MTRYLLVVWAVLMIAPVASACDACGCSIIGQPNGLLANYRKSYLSAGYSHAAYTGAPGVSQGAIDHFHTFDVSFDYYFSGLLRAGISIPFRLNTRTLQEEQSQVNGISDIRMDVNYTFLRQDRTASGWEVYLEAGGGMTLPTGKYNPDIHDSNLPENFNPGKGSFGYTLQQTSGFSYKSIGMVIRNAWTDFAPTSDGYEYGAQWVSSLLVLADIPLDSVFSLVPLGSIQYEKVWNDKYSTGTDVLGTGGNGVFLTIGGQLKIKNSLCTFQYSIPLAENYSSGEVIAGNRYSLQLTHLF